MVRETFTIERWLTVPPTSNTSRSALFTKLASADSNSYPTVVFIATFVAFVNPEAELIRVRPLLVGARICNPCSVADSNVKIG